MHFLRSLLFVVVILVSGGVVYSRKSSKDVQFDVNYGVTWGKDRVLVLNQGRDVQLYMDRNSGSGFGSKLSYGSGAFHLRIKVPDRNSAGVVTAFYLTSEGGPHDELDFEFLGNKEGKPITLQTNVFANGVGNREQRVLLWFDPTADFHTYKIIWNQHQIVFFVDETPIRVFKNNTSIGVMYPTQAMKVKVSLWDGNSWATDGGLTKTDWSYAPFVAHFEGFNVPACPMAQHAPPSRSCYDSNYWWNGKQYWNLHPVQHREYEEVRRKYMNYDYCDDRKYHPIVPPECASNGA